MYAGSVWGGVLYRKFVTKPVTRQCFYYFWEVLAPGKDFLFFHLCPIMGRLGVGKKLRRDTVKRADPNCPKGYTIACSMMLSKKKSAEGWFWEGTCCSGTKWALAYSCEVMCDHFYILLPPLFPSFIELWVFLFFLSCSFYSLPPPTGDWKRAGGCVVLNCLGG